MFGSKVSVVKRTTICLCIVLTGCLLFCGYPLIRKKSFETVFEVYKKNLHYLQEPHPRLMILFSGTPGMGKTVVAKRLEERFHAVRLSTDDLRPILRNQKLKQDLANTYLEKTAERLLQTEANHLFVFDKVIDRTFDRYYAFAKEHHYTIFLVQMKVSRSIVEDRIRSRNHDVENTLSQLDFAWKNYEDFGRSHEIDFVFDNERDIEPCLSQLMATIDAKLHVVYTQST